VIEELVELFDNHLFAQGFEAKADHIDATLVPFPKQSNSSKKNETIKERGNPEKWLKLPNRL
jgi:hypothetical protein